jgi:hypothetical protein
MLQKRQKVLAKAPSTRDRCMISPALTVVLYDTHMEHDAALGPLSLLMKGEIMPAGSRWHGIPTVADNEKHQHRASERMVQHSRAQMKLSKRLLWRRRQTSAAAAGSGTTGSTAPRQAPPRKHWRMPKRR